MKRMKPFDFEVIKLPGPPRFVCKFITSSNDYITLYGNTIEDIFEQCISKFPEGLNTRGITFSGKNIIDAKRNLFHFLSLGFGIGYFKEIPQANEE